MKLYQKIILSSALLGGAAPFAEAQHTQVFTNDERYLHEGLELFDREKYGAAQEAFAKYISLIGDDTKTIDAQYYYAVSGLYLLHPDAEKLILNFATKYPTHPKAGLAYYQLGLFYFDKKNYNKVIEYLEKVPKENLDEEQKHEAEFKQAYAYFAEKKFDKAKPLFDRNKGGSRKYAYASSYYAGYIALRNGDYASAKTDLRTAEQNEAYRAVVPYLLTQILYKEGSLDEVISYGEKVLAQKPVPQNADEIELLIGDAYFKKNDFKNAAKYFNAYAKGRKNIENGVQYKIAYANYKTEDYKAAIVNFKDVALQKDSLGQNAAYHLGLSYLKDNNKQYALTAFNQARIQEFDKPVTEAASIKYAQLNYETGNFREVINSLSDFNKKFPNSKMGNEADDILSESYLNSNNYLEAIRHIEKLSNRSPRINETYQRVTYYQAVNYFNDSKFQEAVALLDKSLEHNYDPEIRAASYFLKGEAYSIAQRWDDAANSYAAVFRTSNANKTDYYVKSRYGIGYAYYNNKQYDKAQTHFKAYINDNSVRDNNPNLMDATMRLGDTYYVEKDYKQALNLYDKVLASNSPDKDYVYFQKGVVLGLMGRKEEAAKNLQSLVNNFPKSRYADDATYQKAVLDFENGNYAPAISGFTNLIDNRPQSSLIPNAIQKRGVAYVNLRKYDEAIADFKKVLDNYPNSKVANSTLYSLQEALNSQNRSEEFDAYLAKFKSANPASEALESVEFEAAKNLYFKENYKSAIPKFEAYLKSYGNSVLAVDARYFLADSYLRTGDKATALKKLKEVVAENRTEYVSKAIAKVADLEFENKNYSESLKYYSRLRDISSSRREQANAMLGMLKSYYQATDYENTRKVANDLLNTGNATLNATNTALLYKGKASYAQGNMENALTELKAALTATDENGAEAQYLIAEILNKQKRYKESTDAAYKMTENYANYEYWLGRAFIIIADNYAAQGENFQARATLNSIIENSPFKEVQDLAKARLGALDNTAKPADDAKGKNDKKTKKNLNATEGDTIR
ncbi:tetratricopeptide repeat protein [Adhaeribacter sp. BT258]|uniref:Tetratricopeptide repeat protein n=1 Tax=Adhaeribacter terrigena TaxID=2793070 RepID=A0ABS1C122_9BACT|nr:tetratricopeptide repeat protein [Adhaeribacter terrigena]MBK0402876.1 tetratricopeptide repeat protein [Adhaeribacter terrigena]